MTVLLFVFPLSSDYMVQPSSAHWTVKAKRLAEPRLPVKGWHIYLWDLLTRVQLSPLTHLDHDCPFFIQAAVHLKEPFIQPTQTRLEGRRGAQSHSPIELKVVEWRRLYEFPVMIFGNEKQHWAKYVKNSCCCFWLKTPDQGCLKLKRLKSNYKTNMIPANKGILYILWQSSLFKVQGQKVGYPLAEDFLITFTSLNFFTSILVKNISWEIKKRLTSRKSAKKRPHKYHSADAGITRGS